MKYAKLGNSGLKVSPICLGAMIFGNQTSTNVAAKIINTARDAGVNFIDTAESYTKGERKRILSKLTQLDRHDRVIATELGGKAIGDGLNQRRLSRAWMMDAIDGSLKRIGTDYVDIYYLHRADPTTPLRETITAMGDLIRAGKVRYWGFSNFRAWKIPAMINLCDELNVPRPVIAQPFYNVLYRVAEFEYIPACHEYGVGVVPYSTLARGVLTGKFGTNVQQAKNTKRGAVEQDTYAAVCTSDALRIAQKVKKRAEAQAMTAGHLALNWVLNNDAVPSLVAGPRTLSHWKDYLAALKHNYPAEDEVFFDALAPSCYPLNIGYHDQKDPPLGRFSQV